jgi:hypothetical protein
VEVHNQWLAAKAAHQHWEERVEGEMRIDQIGGARLLTNRLCIAECSDSRRLVHGPSDMHIVRRHRDGASHDRSASLQLIAKGMVQISEVAVEPAWLIWEPTHSQ